MADEQPTDEPPAYEQLADEQLANEHEQHADEQHADEQYLHEQNSHDQHAEDQYAHEQHANEQHANEQHANEQHADEQYTEEQQHHAHNQHADEQQQHTHDQHADEQPTASRHETPIPPLYRERYEIARDHDVLLVVKNWINHGEFVFEFEVSRHVLTEIPYFRRLLTRESRQGEQEVVILRGDDPKAWKTLLQILHGRLERSSYEIPTDAVWHILLIAEKYGISPTRQNARDWFNGWLVTQSHEGLFTDNRRICEILFPCHAFDHALGFSACTMWLAYNSVGHIKEMRPAYFDEHEHTHLRLDHGIMQQVNAARGRLKTILHRGLYDEVDKLLAKVRCPLRKDILWEYFTALNKTRSWPLERYMSKESICGLLSNLESFEYHDPHLGRVCNWPSCGQDFKQVVNKAIDETAKHFNGLCLDCMNGTSATEADKAKWNPHDKRRDWSEGCRIPHEEPTYFYSVMPHREKREGLFT